jgi:hypothetical protein
MDKQRHDHEDAGSKMPKTAVPQAEAHPRRKGWQERPGEELQEITTCDYNAPTEVTSWQRAVIQGDECTQLEAIVGQMASRADPLRPEDAPRKESFMMLAEQASGVCREPSKRREASA